MLSNTCKYGIRAVIYIALNSSDNRRIGIKEISKELEIPTPFLGKILQTLAKDKLLISTKGPNGGFGLARPAKKISLLDIIEKIDGTDIFDECLIGLRTCSATKKKKLVQCPIHEKYEPISKQIYELYKNEDIQSLVNDIKESEGKIGL